MAAVATLLLLCSFFLAGSKAETLRDEIEATITRFVAAFNRQDAEAVSEMYTDDCTMMPTGSDVVQGKDNVKKWLTASFEMGVSRLELKLDELGPPDATDTLYERSHFTFFDKEGNMLDKGKHIVIGKLVNGEWHLHVDIFNSNVNPQAPATADALRDEIVAVDKQYEKVWHEQDAEGIASFYTTDAKIMAAGMDVFHGREAIRDFNAMTFDKMGMTDIKLDTVEVSPMGMTWGMAYERGYYTLSGKDGSTIDYGKYIFVWKKVDGQWKMYVDIYTTNSDPTKSHDEL